MWNPKTHSSWSTSLVLLLLLGAGKASADLLFLDFNGSDSEMKVAAKVARARGEKLHIVPQIAPEIREALTKKDLEIYSQESRLKRLNKKIFDYRDRTPPQTLIDQKQFLADEVERMKMERNQLASTARVDTGTLHKQFREVVTQNLTSPITSLILSGHSNGESFFGHYGGLSERSFRDLFQSTPSLQSHLRGVYLWGCYTATRAHAVSWKEKLPGADFLIGFHQQAPSNMTSGGPALLESALTLENSLARATTPQAAERALRSIKDAAFYPLAGLFHRSHLGIKLPTTLISDQDLSCSEALSQLEYLYRSVYLRNLRGQTPGGEIDTSNRSELRQFYTRLQGQQHCSQVRDKIEVLPTQVLALLHPKQIMANFVAQAGNRLLELRSHLSALPHGNFAAGLLGRLQDGTLTRQELMSLGEELKKHLSLEELWDDEDAELLSPYEETSPLSQSERDLVRTFLSTLVKLECVPLSWIEMPVNSIPPEAPQCE